MHGKRREREPTPRWGVLHDTAAWAIVGKLLTSFLAPATSSSRIQALQYVENASAALGYRVSALPPWKRNGQQPRVNGKGVRPFSRGEQRPVAIKLGWASFFSWYVIVAAEMCPICYPWIWGFQCRLILCGLMGSLYGTANRRGCFRPWHILTHQLPLGAMEQP